MKRTSGFAYIVFRIVRWLVRFFYGKADVVGIENLPENNAVVVANHTQMNGPIVGELFMPDNCYIWCAGEMMDRKAVPEYAFKDFWSEKPEWTHPFYRLLSHIIAPLAYCLFNNARTLPVYHDMRIITTFKRTIEMLDEGKNMLIFPEKEETNNNVVNAFQENFIDVAKLYYKKSGVELTFVPMYIAPKLRKMYIGKGIKFNHEAPLEEERKRISGFLSDSITAIARELPLHTVVPYDNIPKKQYLTNKETDKVPSRR